MKTGDRQRTEKEAVTKDGQTGSKKPGYKKKPVKKLLSNNTKVKTNKTKRVWCVQAHIGSGGFGDVYRVYDEPNPKMEYAMKTEVHGAQQRRLSIEKSILKEIDTYTTTHKKSRHFCELIDSGQTKDYSWIVMTLIGPSLESVRRMLKRQYTKSCVINMALQILDAVEVMHEVGFIHRDLKPANICTGTPPQDDHVLYVLDFGISRRVFKSSKCHELRNKRERVPFFGTRKFSSRACHQEKDQGRKDDMETYLYTILDLFHNERGLSWKLDKIIPSGIDNIIVYLRGLKFEDPVDYRQIENELRTAGKKMAPSDSSDETMDWTGKLEQLLKEANKNKAVGTPKGEETLLYERLKAKRDRDMTTDAVKTVEMRATINRDVDASEGMFNDKGLTTRTTLVSVELPPPPPPPPQKPPTKQLKSRTRT
eukprot:NP_498132.2 Uncharacterized protein CELE_T15B12.2 [Caenorhabditis elegans]